MNRLEEVKPIKYLFFFFSFFSKQIRKGLQGMIKTTPDPNER